MGLRLRVVLILAIPALVLVAAHGYLRTRQERQQLIAEDRRNMNLTAAAIQVAIANALRDRQIGDVHRLVDEMVERQDTIERIRLFDTEGRATLVSPAGSLGDTVSTELLQRVLRAGMEDSVYDTRKDPPLLYYFVPIRGRSGDVEGVMEIVHAAKGIGRRTAAAVTDVIARLTLLLIALVLLTWFALQRQVLRPLARLTEGIHRLGRGEPGPQLAVARHDELGRVAEAFNQMADDLARARLKLLAETERALEFEQQLRRAETLAVAGRLTSSLAHEVGTPLNIISGRAEFLAKSLPVDDPGRRDLEIIVAQIDRITRIIASVLDTVRPHRPKLEPTSIGMVFDAIVPLLQHAAGRRPVTLTTAIDPHVALVLVDPGQLQQVLINLVMNAIDATPPGGCVEVSARPGVREHLEGVTLAVVDTGAGIAPAALARVFEPFYTTKDAGRGTGLGLAICHDIVTAHDGEIAVQSRVGEGTTFTVWLPAVADEAAA